MAHWTLDDIDWQAFDRSKTDEDTIRIIKAASLVEFNGNDYARYLERVFAGDAAFIEAAWIWAKEEVQHGEVLRRWAELADPEWNFDDSFKRFTEGYSLPQDVETSVRGSRCGELIARCVVEVGTSSYYSALRDSTDEPVLKQICGQIASDEFRHYKLFYDHMKRYRQAEKPWLVQRMKVAVSRLVEGEDDELAYAYYASNNVSGPYDRKACIAAYGSRALPHYERGHVKLATNMVMKAVGMKPQSRVAKLSSRVAWHVFDRRRRQIQATASGF
jgi:rubrerythrin